MNEKNKLCEKTTERRMTILHGNAQNYPENSASCFRLSGKWLYDAGFHPGDKIVIHVSEGQLLIRKEEP
ncbi:MULTISPECIES: SymE family type I addiction module toxin [Bacteroidales]|uniref:SymE family type I addiction module toxin n=1 Tax=Bacteroidales TaxID=171549 RepID=UPI00257003F8|nr:MULTISPECIES: SymE family type I addiction module toxin [Bacteroidales]